MTDEWIPALGRYAQRLHTTAGARHHVASPLGAWLLLALTASAEPAGDELAEVLGVRPAEAASVASALLTKPHPLVAAATAVWHAEGRVDPRRLEGWRAGLPAATEVGPLPDQAALDRWAREHTFGLIDRFPIELTPQVVLLLASALATRLSWDTPFEVGPAETLGGPWASRLTRVLRTPRFGHRAFVATSRHAGEVIVHAAPATDAESGAQVRVVSVAAAGDVPPDRVIAAAYEIGRDAVTGGPAAERTSLFDLPLGDGQLWSIREKTAAMHDAEQVSAVLPAWSATSDHDLSAPELGFGAATRVLEQLVGFHCDFEAKQAATARFGRYGFEAAAVTGFATLTSMPEERPVRFAELRFAHPYAVVAVTDQPGPWHGVPVFSAWVTEPEDEAAG
ncbi:hypothetical protein [Actinoplanes aureus]|uniref:Uncharacterized protein n=1 Tax=Actinoplanes aureus TaxID=2792083 RepID=A0A931CHC6_9ACTN|nr:hypothetical protein [Actinoplanes aureus]MBG0567592.1 hypothetical protein [Actinoplanes aureus]